MTHILKALDFQVEHSGGEALRVTPPDYRTDIDGTDDVLEEIVRIHGFERIPSTLIRDALPPLEGNIALEQEEAARDVLVDTGLQEIVTYSFTNPAHEAAVDLARRTAPQPFRCRTRPYVAIANPISEERSVLRQTLLGNMLDIAASNLRYTPRVALYEIGPVFLKRAEGETEATDLPEDKDLPIPLEPRRLGMVMTGPRELTTWQLTAAKTPDNGNAHTALAPPCKRMRHRWIFTT